MDDEQILVGGNGSSFITYMFSLNEGEKIELVNLFQYVLLAIIPILLVVKLMSTYIPDVDYKKGTVEITVEVVIQLVLLFGLFFFIHKLILFIPTYSKQPYPSINFFVIALPLIFTLFTLDKTIGEKSSILIQRIFVMVGISKENFDGADLKELEDSQNEVSKNTGMQVSGQQMIPPQMSNPSSTGIYEPPVRKSDRGQPQIQTQQYGISEPLASNELCGFSSF
uniref:Uncharacterized protein n=1 Tax=viral metagenome TaxID=1070528 RepID=A0A6C0JMB8_9ZZZZ